MADTTKLSILTAGELTGMNGSAEYLLQVHALHGVLPAGLASGLSQLHSDIANTTPADDETGKRIAELGDVRRCVRTLIDSELDVVRREERPYLLDIADRADALIAAMRAEAEGYSAP